MVAGRVADSSFCQASRPLHVRSSGRMFILVAFSIANVPKLLQDDWHLHLADSRTISSKKKVLG